MLITMIVCTIISFIISAILIILTHEDDSSLVSAYLAMGSGLFLICGLGGLFRVVSIVF